MSDRPHVCESCGRACGPCAEAAQHGRPLPHTIRMPWCNWCTTIYMDNAPDPETGRVHCADCDAPFPDLAAFIASGLGRYPRYCRYCRTRAEARDVRQAATRAKERPPPRTAEPPPRLAPPPPPPPSRKTTDPREQSWARGGFRARPGPETEESELGDGRAAWGGVRVAR